MKKFYYFALMGAMVLTGMVGFTACSSDDVADQTEINPEDIGKTIATQFALNIGRAPQTRSTAVITQNNNNFRGMDNIVLIPMCFRQIHGHQNLVSATPYYYAGDNVDFTPASVPYTNAWNTTIYELGAITNSEISTAHSSKVYSLTLPVGTNNFLFYGKATRKALTTTVLASDEDALNGNLTVTASQTSAKAADINATLKQIDDTYATPQTTLLGILNGIAGVSGWSTLDNTVNTNETLIKAYQNFTTVNDEVRAGSAEAIRATVQELYRTVLAQERVGQTTDVKTLANAIRTKIEESFDVFFDMTASDNNVFDTQVASANVNAQASAPDYDYPYYAAYLKFKSTDQSVYNFPTYQGLPAGSARLTCSSGTFSYMNDNTSITSGSSQDISNIMFPAELTYFANTGLRATEDNKEVADYPITVDSWDNPSFAKWNNWNMTAVTAGTRAVAMKNNINYGVAMLESTLCLGEAAASNSLKDNRKAIVNDGLTEDQTIAIDVNSFILTGVLVGGQPSIVGWDFLPTSTAEFNKVIYDRMMDNGANAEETDYFAVPVYPNEAYDKDATATYNYVDTWLTNDVNTNKNYTLVLDNYKTGAASQDVVNVAVELINNTGQDFYGKGGVIPAGGTFYIVGQLDPTSATAGDIDWDSYTATGNMDYQERFPAWNEKRVFAQDHTTVANFRFSADALKNAYSVIPDLRSIQMTFGLSVDLTWKSGLNFNIDL